MCSRARHGELRCQGLMLAGLVYLIGACIGQALFHRSVIYPR